MDMEAFLKRWYMYARLGKIQATDPRKRSFYKEQMDYIEAQWKELKQKELSHGMRQFPCAS